MRCWPSQVDKIRPIPDTSTQHNGLLVGEQQQEVYGCKRLSRAELEAAAVAAGVPGATVNPGAVRDKGSVAQQ